MIFIGIDPAFRKNGFTIAIVDEENTVGFRTFRNGFHDFLGWLINDCPDEVVFGIENSNLQKAVFRKGQAVSVGKNQAASQYTVDACRLKSIHTYEWSPREKGAKPTHTDISYICMANKWKLPTGRTNQDERDSVKMAHMAYCKFNIIKK